VSFCAEEIYAEDLDSVERSQKSVSQVRDFAPGFLLVRTPLESLARLAFLILCTANHLPVLDESVTQIIVGGRSLASLGLVKPIGGLSSLIVLGIDRIHCMIVVFGKT
jgi:hypothetical protein